MYGEGNISQKYTVQIKTKHFNICGLIYIAVINLTSQNKIISIETELRQNAFLLF